MLLKILTKESIQIPCHHTSEPPSNPSDFPVPIPFYFPFNPSPIYLAVLKMQFIILSANSKMSRRRRQDRQDESSKQAQEAQEVRVLQQDQQAPISDEQGQDLQENAQRDYQHIEELDKYEDQGVDNEQHELDQEARRLAERDLEERERRRRMAERREQVDVEDYMEEDRDYEMRQMERRQMLFREEEETEEEVEDPRYLDVEEARGKLSEWLREEQTLKFIKSKFSKFLKSFQGEANHTIYYAAIREMCTSNKQSIQINYQHIKMVSPMLALWIAEQPLLIFPYLNTVAYHIACRSYPSFQKVHPQVFVKIKNLPIQDQLRDLRYTHLNKLVHVSGVITKRSIVYSQLKKIIFRCHRCGQLKQQFLINNFNDIKKLSLGSCPSCQSLGPFLIDKTLTVYRNYQNVTIQQAPQQVPPGRIPRQKQVILLGDNIDVARPGDQVDLIGIYMNRYSVKLNVSHGLPVFSTIIEANYINRVEDKDALLVDEESEERFRQFARQPDVVRRVLEAIAPNIYGHENIKMGLALAMFGGEERRKAEDTHKVRGDINVLIMGDPGTAKSQLLKSVQQAFYRCVYTTGKGASAVGLTASVKMDFATNEWVLEAGALVLADKGICLIDEFDKMNEKDRTSIHQAMQQQSISISKAGIVTTLHARCSVIAAANPIKGRYDPQKSFRQNVDLTDPILSRFDILCVVRDQINLQLDTDLSTFVINQHMKNHPTARKHNIMNQPLEQTRPQHSSQKKTLDFIKRYIKYAREKCHPQILNPSNMDLIKQFYIQLRQESEISSGISIAVRHMESVIRMATAHAKMHLRSEVMKEDVQVAIRQMLRSFIQTQKVSVSKLIDRKFRHFL